MKFSLKDFSCKCKKFAVLACFIFCVNATNYSEGDAAGYLQYEIKIELVWY